MRRRADDPPVYPKDLYGLAKRLTVDMSDVTLIPFGVFARYRFVKMVLERVEQGGVVEIFQEAKFSWVNLKDIPRAIKWAIEKGKGRYNLCGFRMTLTELARFLGAKKISYLKDGWANEYTGYSSEIELAHSPVIER